MKAIGQSYAQNFEDVLLWRALGHVGAGRYLDIGACDPVADSVSKAFYEAGWRGIHVDASATYAAALRADRPDELVIQAAVGESSGTITFYEFPETGLSTCVAEFAERHIAKGHPCIKTTVPTIPLSSLLELADGPIHWLKIDVEGLEGSVLRSWGDSPARPWVLAIESTEPNTQIPAHGEWIDLVVELGYHEVANDGLSRFFVSNLHPELDAAFADNPNIFDDFTVTPRHFAARSIVATWHAERDHLQTQLDSLTQERNRLEGTQAELDRAHREVLKQQDSLAATIRSSALELSRLRAESGAFAAERRQFEKDAAAHHIERITLTERLRAIEAEREQLNALVARIETAATEKVALMADALLHERARLGDADRRQSETLALAHELQLAQALLMQQLASAAHALDEAKELLGRRAFRVAGSIFAGRETRRVRSQLATWHHAITTGRMKHLPEPTEFPAQTGSMERPMDMFTADARNPYLRANSLAELCALSDLDFVRCAYVTILGRQPEPAGEAYYVARIRSGIAKLTILRQLRLSPEARQHDPGIAGLDVVLRKHRNANAALIGPIIRRLFGREGNSPIERRLRAIENAQAVATRQATDRFLHMNHVLHELDHSVLRIRQEMRNGMTGRGGVSRQTERQIAQGAETWSGAIAKSLVS